MTDNHLEARFQSLERSNERQWETFDLIKDELKVITVQTSVLPKLAEDMKDQSRRLAALEKREQYRRGRFAVAWAACTTGVAALAAWVVNRF